jgi:hypothetical protein
MAKSKLSRKLDRQEPVNQPPFKMADPNSDIAAFGWAMDRLRYPGKDSTKDDVWPGRSIFEIAEAQSLAEQYGFDINFVNAKFIQVMLDRSVAIRNAAQHCAEDNYSPESRTKLRNVINKEFQTVILPEIIARFKKISALLADYYAARVAHLMTYGPEDEN